MPHIRQEQRDQLDPAIHLLVRAIRCLPIEMDGPLNYAITRLLLGILPTHYRYSDLRDALGTLDAVKLEFYRKKVAPYEDEKALENGDVYQAH